MIQKEMDVTPEQILWVGDCLSRGIRVSLARQTEMQEPMRSGYRSVEEILCS